MIAGIISIKNKCQCGIERIKKVQKLKKMGKKCIKLLNMLASLYSLYTFAEPHIQKRKEKAQASA